MGNGPCLRTNAALPSRFTFHFVPKSRFRLNAVEGFFAKLTQRRLKHGIFCSIADLQAAINRFFGWASDRTSSHPVTASDPGSTARPMSGRQS